MSHPTNMDELREDIKAEVLKNARYTYKLSYHNFLNTSGLPTVSYHHSLNWTVNEIMSIIEAFYGDNPRVDELKRLVDFLKASHLYDQDTAMKLSYYIGQRMLIFQHPATPKEQTNKGENV